MEQIQFISVTPEQLQNAIVTAIKIEIDKLKENYTLIPKQPEYLTRKHIKKMLHIDLSTISNWEQKRIIKGYKIGSRIFYKRSEIELAIKPIINE